MKILYLFKDSGKNIKLAEIELFPKLFYGYFQLRESNTVQFIDLAIQRSLFGKIYNKFFGAASLGEVLKHRVNLLNRYDIIYATTDGIAIEVAKLKKEGLIKAKVIANVMSMADNRAHSPYLYLLNYLDGLICFSQKIKQYLDENSIQNTQFIQYGIDTKFYKKSTTRVKNKRVLSIGLDQYRDWEYFTKVAKLLPDVEFRVITNFENQTVATLPNVIFLGDTSFVATRNELAKAKLVFLPTKPNHYFSGQTTLFNALSMKKYVLMPKDENFKDYNLHHNMFYGRNESLSVVVKKIQLLLSQEQDSVELRHNHAAIVNQYNETFFSKRLEECMRNVYGR